MQEKPNVLIIHADQLRADCIQPYGNTQVKTPCLSALAQDSVQFHHHFCVYPVCTPSRYSMLSGLQVHQHLGWDNHCTIPPAVPVFPKLLRQNGWRTAAVGKMHFTPAYLDMGFDTMILAEQNGAGRFCDDYHRDLMKNGYLDEVDLIDQCSRYRTCATKEYFESFGAQVSNLPEEYHSTAWITNRALDQIEKWKHSGNLLMVGYIKPHHPFDPPQRYADLYDPDQIEILPGYTDDVPQFDDSLGHGYFDHKGLTRSVLQKMTAYYYASISQIDEGIGRIITLLKEKGLYENTMLIFTSDHGDYLGYHHMALKSNHMYEPLMRIPLIIKYPHQTGGGTHESSLSDNSDLAGEILRVCGVKVPPAMSTALKTGKEYIVSEYMATPSVYHYMVRDSRYKLLLSGGINQAALFDLKTDPYELTDQSKNPAYQQILETLKQHLFQTLAFDRVSPVYLDPGAATVSTNGEVNPEEMRESMWRRFCADRSISGEDLHREK